MPSPGMVALDYTPALRHALEAIGSEKRVAASSEGILSQGKGGCAKLRQTVPRAAGSESAFAFVTGKAWRTTHTNKLVEEGK